MADDESRTLTRPGFWCERVIYRSLAADEITSVATCATTNPEQAIRHICVNVRVLASALPPREMVRAFAWANEHGCLRALAALHRGEPCGFSLNSLDAWVEWTVRPVVFLTLAAPESSVSCPGSGDGLAGWKRPGAALVHLVDGRGPAGDRRSDRSRSFKHL